MSDMQNVIDRINKLRALAASTTANEAANAAAAADALISKHQLSEAQLIINGSKNDEQIEVIRQHLHESGRIMQWIHDLANTLCNHYGCSYYEATVFDPNKVAAQNANAKRATYKAFVLVGRRSDAEIVQYFFDWLRTVVDELVKKNARGQGMVFSQNYARGVVNGIRLQLKGERDKLASEAAATNQSTAMVMLSNRAVAADKFMRSAIKLKQSQASKLGRDLDAFGSGTEQGKKIQLKKGLPSNGGGANLLS